MNSWKQASTARKILVVGTGIIIALTIFGAFLPDTESKKKEATTETKEAPDTTPTVDPKEQARLEAAEKKRTERERREQKKRERELKRKEARERQEAAKKDEAEYRSKAKTIDYPQLVKAPDRYTGKALKYRGKILQAMEDADGITTLILQVTDQGYDLWTDEILVVFAEPIKSVDGDIVTIYGTSSGNESYETQIGGSNTVPSILGLYIDE